MLSCLLVYTQNSLQTKKQEFFPCICFYYLPITFFSCKKAKNLEYFFFIYDYRVIFFAFLLYLNAVTYYFSLSLVRYVFTIRVTNVMVIQKLQITESYVCTIYISDSEYEVAAVLEKKERVYKKLWV